MYVLRNGSVIMASSAGNLRIVTFQIWRKFEVSFFPNPVVRTLGAVGGFRKWSCEDLKIKKYLRQNGNTGTLQAVV